MNYFLTVIRFVCSQNLVLFNHSVFSWYKPALCSLTPDLSSTWCRPSLERRSSPARSRSTWELVSRRTASECTKCNDVPPLHTKSQNTREFRYRLTHTGLSIVQNLWKAPVSTQKWFTFLKWMCSFSQLFFTPKMKNIIMWIYRNWNCNNMKWKVLMITSSMLSLQDVNETYEIARDINTKQIELTLFWIFNELMVWLLVTF